MSTVVYEFCKIDVENLHSVVTIGKFDGVHRGHKKLLSENLKIAKKNNLLSVAILIKKRNVAIYRVEDSISFIEELGFNYIIVVDFLPEFYTMEAKEFFNKLIEYYNMKHIVVGVDFAFGKDRMGDKYFLEKYSKENNIEVLEVPHLLYKKERISSSRIREALSNGDISSVNKMLGREYSMTSRVIHGNALGRKIGYPTANMELFSNIFVPKMGVYSSYVKVEDDDRFYQALTFIGISNINNELRVESHILDFSADIYDKQITLIPLKYIRDNVRVNGIDELKKILKKDEQNIRNYFKRRTKCL